MGPDPSKVRIQQLKGSGKSEFEIRIHTIKIKNRKETRLTDKTSPSPVRTFLIWHFLIINNNLITVFSLKINSVTTCIPAQIWIQSRGTFLDPDPNKLYLYPQHCAKQIFVPIYVSYCAENKFIDYLWDVQLDRWWTGSYLYLFNSMLFLCREQVHRLSAGCAAGPLAGLDPGAGPGALHQPGSYPLLKGCGSGMI